MEMLPFPTRMLFEPFLHLQRVYRFDKVTPQQLQQITCDKVRVGISRCMSNMQGQCRDFSFSRS